MGGIYSPVLYLRLSYDLIQSVKWLYNVISLVG